MLTGRRTQSKASRIFTGLLVGFLVSQMTPLIWAQKAPVPTGGGGGGSGNIIARFRSRPVLPATATDSLSVAFRNRSWGPITSLRLGLGDSLERLYRLSLRRSKGG